MNDDQLDAAYRRSREASQQLEEAWPNRVDDPEAAQAAVAALNEAAKDLLAALNARRTQPSAEDS